MKGYELKGGFESPKDKRTVSHRYDMAEPLVKGGFKYGTNEIEHQHKVGICTAISTVQNREKANGKKYSPDFQYLLQKKFYDYGWFEGSSLLSALKVGKKFGFLPASEWTHTTEKDRLLPYETYQNKLKGISDTEIDRLLTLCVDKIAGYASVDITNPQAIASAIDGSEAGILCRYDCGSTWWVPSWEAKDINPLRRPKPATSGHAICMSEFDYTNGYMQILANTWGVLWCNLGCADINWSNYPMTEAWVILRYDPITKYVFTKTLKYGIIGTDVIELQKKLKTLGFFPQNQLCTGIFLSKTKDAVMAFQKANGLVADGIVGKNTINLLNK